MFDDGGDGEEEGMRSRLLSRMELAMDFDCRGGIRQR